MAMLWSPPQFPRVRQYSVLEKQRLGLDYIREFNTKSLRNFINVGTSSSGKNNNSSAHRTRRNRTVFIT